MTILTATTGLANELTFDFYGVADRLTISHLWLTNIGINRKLAAHTINDNIKVQFTHARNNGLPSLWIGSHPERRIFLRQLTQRSTHFILVSLTTWLNRHRNDGLWEFHAL